jgi:hypothetical protein
MHAVVTRVTIQDPEKATTTLREEVVPGASQAPGFVAGYWVRLPDGTGNSVIVFESEDAARAAKERIQPPPDVTVDFMEVGEVVANA